MTFSHDEANARLLDLVYGEGSADERAALEAHVATCAACTAELASLGDTRARLRTALEDAPVPARAHARILEAATQAAAPLAAAASAGAPAMARSAAAPAPRARQVVAPGGPSFWEKLRSKWTLPTFATVGAVAIVVIASKVFLEPQKTNDLGRQIAGAPPAPTAVVAPPAAEPAAPEPAAAPAEPMDELQRRLAAHAAQGGAASAFKDAHGSRPSLLGGNNLGQRLAHRGASGSAAGLAEPGAGGGGNLRERSVAPAVAAPAPSEAKPAKGSLDDLLEGALAKKPAPKAERAAEAEAGKSAVRSEAASRRDYAPPPAGWQGGRAAAPPPPAAAPSAPRAVARKSVADNPLDGVGDSYRGSASSGAAEADVQMEGKKRGPSVKKEKASSYAAEESVSAAPAPKPVPTSSNKPSQQAPKTQARAADDEKQLEGLAADKNELKSKADDAGSEAALTRRADQLYAAHRWSEAIAAYRELLRRYPAADAEPRWRARLKESMAQADVQQQAPAQQTSKAAAKPAQRKKSVSDDALE